MHVLLEDERGLLTLQRPRPWDRIRARCLAARLDRELARGARPEASVSLATRAAQLTSMKFRRDLAASLQQMLAAAGFSPVQVRKPHVPIRQARIRQSAAELAELASRLVQPGPVPVRGVAMTCQLLTDGGGPLYREACRDDLAALVGQAVRGLNG